MRKAFFAVVLVAASFAGGAVINGPGLRWAQTMLVNRVAGGGDEPAGDEPVVVKADEPAPPEPIPSTPIPPLTLDPLPPESGKAKAPKPAAKAPAPAPAPLPALAEAGPEPEPKAPAPPEPKAPEPLNLDAVENRPGQAPLQDGDVALAKAPAASEAPPPLGASTAPAAKDEAKADAPGDKDSPWADMPDSAPAAAVPPRPYEGPVAAAEAPKPAAAEEMPKQPTPEEPPKPAPAAEAGQGQDPRPKGEWAEIRRKMAALGVSRYGIEGEPGGRVRFHCLIPLAGRRAVTQQFEAEGDDEFEAAEVALRRVALWRATEDPGR